MHYGELCRFAVTFTNDGNDAEEVVQKVFIRIWENRNKIICPDNYNAFLYKSVYNACLNSYRNNTTRKKHQLDYFLELKLHEETSVDYSEEIRTQLNHAISNLPEKCKQIFVLNKIEGLTQKEIADYLGISVKTVENQIANAISKLRVELKPFLHLLPGFLFIFSKL